MARKPRKAGKVSIAKPMSRKVAPELSGQSIPAVSRSEIPKGDKRPAEMPKADLPKVSSEAAKDIQQASLSGASGQPRAPGKFAKAGLDHFLKPRDATRQDLVRQVVAMKAEIHKNLKRVVSLTTRGKLDHAAQVCALIADKRARIQNIATRLADLSKQEPVANEFVTNTRILPAMTDDELEAAKAKFISERGITRLPAGRKAGMVEPIKQAKPKTSAKPKPPKRKDTVMDIAWKERNKR